VLRVDTARMRLPCAFLGVSTPGRKRSGHFFMEHFYPHRAPAPPAPPAHHNILGCCHHHESIEAILINHAGILERLLQKFEEQYGMPKGDPFSFSQLVTAQNTVYTSNPVNYNGIIRSLLISGPGNITLGINNFSPLGGNIQICRIASSNTPIPIPHHIRVPVGATFTLSTDSNATTLMSMSAWIEPVSLEGQDQYRMKR